MKKLLVLLSLCLPCAVFAQIKKADASMVAGANTAREKAFSEMTAQFIRYTPEKNMNFYGVLCPGERFYVMKGSCAWTEAIINNEWVCTSYQSYIPEGYYKIENVFLTRESLKEQKRYTFLMNQKNDRHLYSYLPSIDLLLKDLETKTAPYPLYNDVVFDVKSEDTGNRYFVRRLGQAMPVRSYEYHSNELLNKDVRLLVDPHKYAVHLVDITEKIKSLNDDLTSSYVPITTSTYRCVDIAVDDSHGDGYGNVQMVAVLENDGNRFALRIADVQAYEYGLEYKTSKSDVYLMTEDSYNKMLANQEKVHKEYEAAVKKAREERRMELVSKYGENFGNLIIDRKVALDMSMEMVRASWGFPEATFNHTNSLGKVTIWNYGLNNYITFYNGKVTAITQGSY